MFKRFAAMLVFAGACSGGTPTNSTCPTTEAPTYADFGQQFMTSYCTDCHSRTSTNRHGAPGDLNFDTEADIAANASGIDATAAKGPAATNTSMPDMSGPVHTAPSDDERTLLGQWLACEMAK